MPADLARSGVRTIRVSVSLLLSYSSDHDVGRLGSTFPEINSCRIADSTCSLAVRLVRNRLKLRCCRPALDRKSISYSRGLRENGRAATFFLSRERERSREMES